MAVVGQQWGNKREPRAWSQLAHSAAVRNCVRTLVFAGAVGVAWLIGSSAASAHQDTDPEVPHAETGVLERLVLTHDCSEESTGLPYGDPEDPTDAADSHGTIASYELIPDDLVNPCATRSDQSPASDSQAAPGSYPGQFSESEGEQPADQDGPIDLIQPFLGHHPVIRPVMKAVGPVTDLRVADGPVVHTGAGYVGQVGAPLLDVIPPAYAAADHVTGPVTNRVTGITRPVTGSVTDPVTGLVSETDEPVTSRIPSRVAPRLDGSVKKLVAHPVVAKPQQGLPADPAPPGAPGVDQPAGSTSTVDSDDEAMPSRTTTRAGRTGPSVGATRAPAAPAPAPVPVPLPAVPGKAATNGTVMSQQVPPSGGGVAATAPAFPVPSAPELGALVATAHDAALRDLAGEPAVSPD